MTKEEYINRVTVLGRYCYPRRGEEAALVVFSCLKRVLSEEDIQYMSGLLPCPVRRLWEEAEFAGGPGEEDCITLAMRLGNYPYRAAAEKAVEVIFASLREIVDAGGREKIKDLLPLSLQVVFERSRSCALDGSAEDFL